MPRKSPTLGARLAGLQAEHDAAVGVFLRSAEILDETANELVDLSADALVSAQQHKAVGDQAEEAALAARDRARRIRELVG